MSAASDDRQRDGGRASAVRWSRWPLLLAVWSLPGLVTTTQVYFLHQRYDPIPFADALLWQMAGWYFWIPATPAILFLVGAFPFTRAGWRRSLPVHLVAAMVFSAAHLAVSIAAGRYLIGYSYYLEEPFGELMSKLFIRNVHLDVVTYVGIVIAGVALAYYRKFRERELAALALESRLARAELHALKGQLHPHFLFNTLNAIAVLVRKQDTARAVKTLTRLGELLRNSLDNAGRQLVSLAQEIEFVTSYLEIQQTRFGDRLSVRIDADDSCLTEQVPNLLLQPLVENSVRHGIAPRSGPGTIEIDARRDGERICIVVRDDGIGLPDGFDPDRSSGIGVGNIKARLAQLYPGRHRFEIENRPEGGVRVMVEIPAGEAAEGADPAPGHGGSQ